MSVACNRNRQIGSYCLLVEKGSDLKFRRPIQQAMYDLEIEAAEGGGGGAERRNIFPIPNPPLVFDRPPPPWKKFLSLPSLPLLLTSKMAAIIIAEKILSTRSPKLRLLCRLGG